MYRAPTASPPTSLPRAPGAPAPQQQQPASYAMPPAVIPAPYGAPAPYGPPAATAPVPYGMVPQGYPPLVPMMPVAYQPPAGMWGQPAMGQVQYVPSQSPVYQFEIYPGESTAVRLGKRMLLAGAAEMAIEFGRFLRAWPWPPAFEG